MNIAAKEVSNDTDDACKFVEVLTATESGEAIGVCFGGARPGPNAIVASDERLIDALSDRLQALPTLPWMWGRLHLVALDGIECASLSDIKQCLPDTAFDEMVLLPYAPGADTHDLSIDQAYWVTLRLCRNLGMIAGRGISDGIFTDPVEC